MIKSSRVFGKNSSRVFEKKSPAVLKTRIFFAPAALKSLFSSLRRLNTLIFSPAAPNTLFSAQKTLAQKTLESFFSAKKPLKTFNGFKGSLGLNDTLVCVNPEDRILNLQIRVP